MHSDHNVKKAGMDGFGGLCSDVDLFLDGYQTRLSVPLFRDCSDIIDVASNCSNRTIHAKCHFLAFSAASIPFSYDSNISYNVLYMLK